MDDLISRQAVLALPRDRIRNMNGEIVEETIDVADIKALPSAEPRKGKWAGKGDSEGFGIFICDACGKFAMMKYDFCPNCGADMRQREGEQDD